MAKRCALTGVGAQSGNKVSHSNHKTRRRFVPNVQTVRLLSDALGRKVTLRITAAALRSVDHNGGIDAYLLKAKNDKLSPEALRVKRQLQKLAKEKAAAAKAA